MEKSIPINDLILFLRSIKKQIKGKGIPYFSKKQMMDFYDEFGDEINNDGVISTNQHRINQMRVKL